MGAHSKKSPSQADRFTNCPGAIPFVDSLPPQLIKESSGAARLGTAAHGLLERCLKEGVDPETYAGRIIMLVGEDEGVSILAPGAKAPRSPDAIWFEVDGEMIEGVSVATDYVKRRMAEQPDLALQLETRTNPLPDRDDTSGTADVTLDGWPDLLEVVDYKNGYVLVQHRNNPQLLAYLLGKALEGGMSHSRYAITVVQPNAVHEEGRVRTFEVTAEELLNFQARHRAAVETVDLAASSAAFGIDEAWVDKWLRAGEDQCFFCEGSAVCPARRALAHTQTGIDFACPPVEMEVAAGDLERAAEIVRWGPSIEALVATARGYLQRGLEAGTVVPGFKLVRVRSYRRWKDGLDEAELARTLEEEGYVHDEADLYKHELLSGPQVEKLVPKKHRKTFNERFLTKPEGRLVLALESDSREGVEAGGADPMFLEEDPE